MSSSKANSLFLYGVHAVSAAWQNPARVCYKLMATEAGLEALGPVLKAVAEKKISRPAPVRVDKKELERLMPGAVHQGLILEAGPLPDLDIEDICQITKNDPPPCVVVLDQVTDPHNIGAILRSASAFGVAAVIVTDRHTPEATAVMAKSASGALEHVPLVRVTNLARALDQLQNAGFWCYGLAEKGEKTLAELNLSGPVALVLGAEGTGLRRLTMETCDEIARLPTTGPVGSLNVSNAAAVALYEIVRQKKK